MSHPSDLALIEAAAVRSWPAFGTASVDGWLWRTSGGGSNRANSVSTLRFTGASLDAAIIEVERLYKARGVPAQFTITPLTEPADLDRLLAGRGYEIADDSVTMAKDIASEGESPSDVEHLGHANAEWLDVYLTGLSADRRPFATRLVQGVPAPRMHFGCRRGARMVSTGLSVLDGTIASVQCMATLPEARRQGGARQILAAIEAWARSRGARRLYLQTGADNGAAQALYSGFGFALACRYHIRAKAL